MSTIKKIGIAVTVFVCGGFSYLAIDAWITHYAWLRSGAYSRNSFPIHQFAIEMTVMAVLSCIVSGGIWLWIKHKYKSRSK